MNTIYKSKIGWWYYLVIIILAIANLKAIFSHNISTIIISSLTLILVIHIMFSTWYKITLEGYLLIHCSIFPEKKVYIPDLTLIENTYNPVSSYALSLDRLALWDKNNLFILISPENKKEFIKELQRYNPYLKIK